MSPIHRRRVVLAGFLLSGVTGLVYQSIWIRMLTLIIGGTTAALTTVLIAFMGGLALGSFLLGGMADRVRSPLRLYAVIEVLVGAYALLLPTLYEQVPAIYQGLHALDPQHGLTFNTLRFVLALTFFGIPATLMGGTLPLIVRTLSERARVLQVTVAEIYAINTFGATIGAFLTGFVVIPSLGLYLTLYSTAIVNMTLGVYFYFFLSGEAGDARDASPVVGETSAQTSPSPEPGGEQPLDVPTPRGLLLGVFFLMGASSLSYEVVWHRLLGLSFGNSVYSVSTMLTSFLLGIAIGSWWLRSRSDRIPATWASLGWIELAIAIAAPLTALVLTLLPYFVQYLFLLPYVATKIGGPEAADTGFWLLQLVLFIIGTLVMLVPTSLMGLSFPLAVRLYARDDVGRSVGRVYASNTFGAIIGLSLTGFFLIGTIGSEATNTAWSVVNGLLGLGLLWMSLRRGEIGVKPAKMGWAAAALVLLLVALPSWSLESLTAGVYYHVIELSSPTLEGSIIFHTEDDMALVSVHETSQWDQLEPAQTVKVNGKFMAGGGNRVPILHLFAHIPIFMRGEGAKSAFVIGLGGGYTTEAALMHPFETVRVAEISRGVIEAAHVTRPQVFDDPRLEVLAEDARSVLLTGDERYDVIISETSDPWMTGVANLYTQECFQWIKAKLAPGGVFGTWLQTRHKTIEDVRIILRTMQSVFPHFAIFELAEGDTLLVMSNEPLRIDAPFLKRRHQALRGEMEAINLLSPWSMMGRLVMGESSAAAYLEGARINTDNRPIIEFTTPRSLNIGLKGQEVWDNFLEFAPEYVDLPVSGGTPWDVALLETHRALHMKWYARALAALEQAETLGAPSDTYLRGRVYFGLDQFDRALALAEASRPSLRQAMLKAGCLTFLQRFLDLETFLRDAPIWQVTPANSWERRILRRRELLLETLEAAAPTK